MSPLRSLALCPASPLAILQGLWLLGFLCIAMLFVPAARCLPPSHHSLPCLASCFSVSQLQLLPLLCIIQEMEPRAGRCCSTRPGALAASQTSLSLALLDPALPYRQILFFWTEPCYVAQESNKHKMRLISALFTAWALHELFIKT